MAPGSAGGRRLKRRHPLREPGRAAALAEAGVHRGAGAEHHAGRSLPGDLVAKGQRHAGHGRHLDAHQEDVLVAGGRHVAARGLDHGQAQALGLHVAVAASVGEEELAPGELEVAEVVGVVHDAHLIGVAVDDPHPRLEHRLLLSETVGVGPQRGQAPRTRARASRLRGPSMTRALSLALVLVATPALAKPPRLTLFIAVDALGTDLLLRSRPQLKAGLANLIDRGAFYPDVRYEQAQVATAPGHSVLSTGAYPWRTGVVGNRVMNRASGKEEPVFWDATHPMLDAPAGVEDVSPEPMLAEALADHLRLFTAGRGKAIALSGKARAAISLAGRLGQAFWFNEQVGRLVTGTAYMKELPAWLRTFNDRRLPDAAFSTDWSLALPVTQYVGEDDRPFEAPSYGMGRTFPHSLKGGAPSPGPPS